MMPQTAKQILKQRFNRKFESAQNEIKDGKFENLFDSLCKMTDATAEYYRDLQKVEEK